jgi:hypothetical protein
MGCSLISITYFENESQYCQFKVQLFDGARCLWVRNRYITMVWAIFKLQNAPTLVCRNRVVVVFDGFVFAEVRGLHSSQILTMGKNIELLGF